MERSPSQVVLDERRGFERGPDGSIVVRRYFGSDAIATAISVVAPIVYLIIVILLMVLLFEILPEGNDPWSADL